MRGQRGWVGVCAGLIASSAGWAQEKTLSVGDPAPKLEISHWLKGEEIKGFEKDKVYVVEFWATWCGPCVASMPHLSELQKTHADKHVTIVGVSDEPLQTVVGFLFKTHKTEERMQNDRVEYTLATDPDRSVYGDYMKAAHQNGIPTAFIVGKSGLIEWVGHPMAMDAPLQAVVEGAWDRAPFKVEFDKMLARERESLKHAALLEEALASKNHEVALQALDALIALEGSSSMPALQKFMILGNDLNNYKGAYEFLGAYVQKHWEEPMTLNTVAWAVVDDADVRERDLDLALKTALRASELTNHENGAILDTVARAYYEKGQLDQAVEWQRKAVDHVVKDTPLATQLNEVLAKYEKARVEKK